MQRLRHMLAVLLPVLWLAASWHGVIEPLGMVPLDSTASVEGLGQTNPAPADDGCSQDNSIGSLWRRSRHETPAPLTGVLFAAFRPVVLAPLSPPHSERVSDLTLWLAHGWQFDTRAAPAPRAPSFAA